MKKVFRVLKFTVIFAIFAVIGLLIARIMIADHYPAGIKNLYASDNLLSATENGARVEMRTQALLYSYDDPDDTRLMAGHFYYSPEAGEVQISIRYNKSILPLVAADFALEETPAPSAELFTFFLEDEKNGIYYPLTHIETDSQYMYHYMKLVFSGIEFSSETEQLCLVAYYTGAVDTEKEPYSHITLYHQDLAEDDHVFFVGREELQ